MINKIISPVDILCRELNRLDNDIDRLQMLVTLKSHLNHLQFNPNTLQLFFSIFNDEQYRLQAINQLVPFIHTFITSDSLTILLELFTNNQYRLNLIETLKNCEPLKINKEVNELLCNEYRQYFLVKKFQSNQNIKNSEDQVTEIENSKETEPTIPATTTSNVTKVLSSTSGVFEKAKQFVCRVFGGSSSSLSLNPELSNKRLINEDNTERKKFHSNIDDDLQFQSTSMPLSRSPSYTSIITKSPPPSPIITHTEQSIARQSSMSFHRDESPMPLQSMMVTQIHSILDNIDSVLDKIEAQANSVIRRPTSNENYSTIEIPTIVCVNNDSPEELPNRSMQQGTDQITQTTINIIERHLNLNDGSGDTTSTLIDLLDIAEESTSIISSESSDEIIDRFID
ncbi:unnamed protein product [Rotaria magnacalcarata]|uniref:Uncharacterized protein n=1 Tax=Rotaria magnacalcarata TaxID=392030 RepID=A0A819T9T6_9BILA|nr:unnamed protein product [Rotaria magnacalcarata]CAF2091769.1 unnamed protein product [Rotaria magnacalcarata]CAF3861152.1 unnamed protein product [Rotaria magnacalcarata]CAF4069363.1 unnamed protein product [Rotaria magnacalcarata]